MNPPRVSIGLPVRNGGRFLAESLEGLLAQQFTDFEIIGSDNASDDRTPEIFAEFAARDPRVRWSRRPRNVGAAANFNSVLEPARGEYFMWAADHDAHDPRFLTRCVETLDACRTAVLCYTQERIVDLDGRLVRTSEAGADTRSLAPIDRFRLVVKMTPAYAVYGLIRTESLRRAGRIRTTYGSDHVLLAQLSLQGEFVWLPEPLFHRRVNRPHEHAEGAWERRIERQMTDLDPKNVRQRYKPTYAVLLTALVSTAWNSALPIGQRIGLIAFLLNLFRTKHAGRLERDLRRAFRAYFGPAVSRVADDVLLLGEVVTRTFRPR